MAKQKRTVSEFMKVALLTARTSDTVEHASTMVRSASVRHLPIIDDSFKVIGIVSSRDLARGLARADAERLTLADIMTRPVRSVRASLPADEAVGMMLGRKIGALPVVDESGTLIGMVTDTDFLQVAYQALTGQIRPGRDGRSLEHEEEPC